MQQEKKTDINFRKVFYITMVMRISLYVSKTEIYKFKEKSKVI